MTSEETLGWIPSPRIDRMATLAIALNEPTDVEPSRASVRVTDFELSIDHHWGEDVLSEVVVWEGDTERGRFPSQEQARAFAEATYVLEVTP